MVQDLILSEPAQVEDAVSLPQQPQAGKPAPFINETTDTSTTPEDEQDTTPTEKKVHDDVEGQDAQEHSEAKQLCPINGRSHATLIEFGYSECRLCVDKLVRPENPMPGPESLEALTADPELDTNYSKRIPNEYKQPHFKLPGGLSPRTADILFSVEYRDKDNSVLHVEPCEGVFDLSAARRGGKWKKGVISNFDVVTVLKASNSPDAWRPAKGSQIFKDYHTTVAIHTTYILIHSTPLLRLLRQSVRYYPSVSLNSTALKLDEPFPLIAHHYQELNDYRTVNNTATSALETEEHQDDKVTGLQHLGELLDYIDNTMLPHIREEQTRYDKGFCTFRMLWLLYKPGSTVYLESEGRLSAFVVQSVETDPAILTTAPLETLKPYLITLWNLAFDSPYVGRTSRTMTVAAFDGERRIVSLRLIPCASIDKDDGGTTRRDLEECGRRWYELLRGGQVYYSGPLLGAQKRQLHGRLYIDPTSFYGQEHFESPLPYLSAAMAMRNDPKRNPVLDFGENVPSDNRHDYPYARRRRGLGSDEPVAKCQCDDCHGMRPHPLNGFPWTRYDILDPRVERDLEIPGAVEGPLHRYLICDRLLHGFDLKSRTWVQVDVAYCRPAKANLRAIDSLVMPEERLNMIKALIQKFTYVEPGKEPHRVWAADFIENKGEGQIFLLHGSPGVGKTYTAECIAEYTERPLLSLTCGDIGTNEEKMEKQLSRWFRLAEKWGAVMLIDEADVYLEKRLPTDLHRNSLVSVFLRCIEYYRGVLFLTTNRVGQFDDAFISRIHVIIRYDNLSADSRRKIWSHFFDKLDDEREDFKTTQRAKDYVLRDGEISKMEWNGREIRNAFQTAVALAEFRFLQNRNSSKTQPTLDQKDFEQVLNMMQQFKTYLVNVHGSNEEERAYNARARAHPYGLPEQNC